MTLITGPLTLNNRTVTLTGYGMEIGILVSVTEGEATPDTPAEGEKKGCGSVVYAPVGCFVILAAAMVIRKKRKENYV